MASRPISQALKTAKISAYFGDTFIGSAIYVPAANKKTACWAPERQLNGLYGTEAWVRANQPTAFWDVPPKDVVAPIPPPPPPSPPPPPPIIPPVLSPEGTTILGGVPGTLTTKDGVWAFGPMSGGNWQTFLKGMQAAGGWAIKMQIVGGNMRVTNAAGGMWDWIGGNWKTAGAAPSPPSQSPPPPPPPPQSPPPPPPPPAQPPAGGGVQAFPKSDITGLAVTIAPTSGPPIVFKSEDGFDLGDWVNPISGAAQRNIVVRNSAAPEFSVFIRPERDGSRHEFVIEWADIWSPRTDVNENLNFGAYTATLAKAGATLGSITVPYHFWGMAARWQSAPRPILRKPADLVAMKAVPPMDRSIVTVALPPAAPPYQPMRISNITGYMPSTGGRPDIGLLTEVTAAYLGTGDATALASMLAWAESSNTFHWHVRDFNTNAPLSLSMYPNANLYGAYSDPPIKNSLASRTPLDGMLQIDGAHLPSLSYIPYMLTGDLRYLEEMQLSAAWVIAATPPQGGLYDHTQARGWAWNARTVGECIVATPGGRLTASLLPRAYWQQIDDKNLAEVMTNFVNNPSPRTAVLFSGMSITQFGPWQEDMEGQVLALRVMSGAEQWRPVLEWKVKSVIARTNGTSGWPQSVPTTYYCTFKKAQRDANGKVVLDANGGPVLSAVDVTTWADLYAETLAVALAQGPAPSLIATADGSLCKSLDIEYVEWARGHLSMAVKAGVTDAAAPLAWLDAQMKIAGYGIEWRHAF